MRVLLISSLAALLTSASAHAMSGRDDVGGLAALAKGHSSAALYLAQAEAAPRRQRPTNLNQYSLQFWPRNTLRANQVVSTTTPYGRLTCRSTGRDQPRQCSLK